MDVAITLDDACRVVRGTPFGAWWGLEVEALGEGWARVTLPYRAEFVRPGGVLHGAC